MEIKSQKEFFLEQLRKSEQNLCHIVVVNFEEEFTEDIFFGNDCFDKKADYFEKAYNDDLTHKSNSKVAITSYYFVDSIYVDSLGSGK